MFCTSCGNTLLPNLKYCTKCGTSNPHYIEAASAAALPKIEQKSEEPKLPNDHSNGNSAVKQESEGRNSEQPILPNNASQSVPIVKQETKRKKRNFKKVFLLFLIIGILGAGSFVAYKYLILNSFEKAIVSFQKGEMEESANYCMNATLAQEQGKLELSDSDRMKLVYMESVSGAFQNKLDFIRTELNQMHLKSLESAYISFCNAEKISNRSVYPENNFGFNIKQILSPIISAHDSLVIKFVELSIENGDLKYPAKDKQLLNVGSDTYLDMDSLLSLIINPDDSNTQRMISSLKLKLPSRPSDTAFFFENLHKADSAYSLNQDSLAKNLYEKALLFKPNDTYAIGRLATLNNKLSKGNSGIKFEPKNIAILEPEIKKPEVIRDLVISLQTSAITWTNLGDSWSYEITIFDKDDSNSVVYKSLQEDNQITFPQNDLKDHRLYILSIESVRNQKVGQSKSKTFSLISNGTRIDPTCKK